VGELLRKMITAPAAVAAGRLLGRIAPVPAIIALLLAVHLPRECFNENGDPKVRHTGQPWHALKVYQCGRCGFWHVGHTGRRRRRGRRG